MTHDMTKGHLLPILIKFTIPLILGNLLQLTYNAVDSIIAGRFVGSEALAAVGTSNPLMTLIILFEQGICLGAGVLIGIIFGAGQIERLKKQVSTAFLAGLVFSVVVAAIMFFAADPLLRLLQVETSILRLSENYLRIISFGLFFNFVYNYFASVLRALGDSKSPLIFLAVSAGLNICGDLFFVVTFDMGVTGLAVATVVSEGISGILCWIYVAKKIPILHLGRHWLDFRPDLLKLTLQYGFVSAMQQSAVQLGKIGIQGIVNTMGVSTTAAFNAVNRPDDYSMVIEQNIAHAMTSVMAQNRGAKKFDRVRDTFRYGIIMELIYGVLIGIIFYLCAEPVMRLFSSDTAVIGLGVKYLRLISIMYILPAVTNGVQGYFRGMGDLKITLVSSMVNMGIRVLAAAIFVFRFKMGFEAIPWSYLAGWIVMLLFELPLLVIWLRRQRLHPEQFMDI